MIGNNENSGLWLKPFNGQWTWNVDPGTEGAKQRTTDSGKTITYQSADYVEGHITDVQHVSDEWDGKKYDNILITLQDADERYFVKLSLYGRMASTFFHTMESIDFSDRVRLVATRNDNRNGMIVIQNNQPLKWNYTKDNPGNRPDKVKVMVQGNETWDSTAQVRWFWRKLQNEVMPKITGAVHTEKDLLGDFNPPAAPAPAPQPVEQLKTQMGLQPTSNDDDDLPF